MKETATAPEMRIVEPEHAPESGVSNPAPEDGGRRTETATEAEATPEIATDGDADGTVRKYVPEQVVCVECEHVREMKGESDECLRRTRSEAAENAVLNAVRSGGTEPDWFVERWVEEEKVLVACAVFEDWERCAGFRKAVNEFAEKLRERGDDVPVRLRSDAALEAAVARHFTEEWRRRRTEQMAKYRAVIADAKGSGEYAGRIVVGEYRADGDDAKKAFAAVAEKLNALFPHDEFGEGGIAYSGFWDKGSVARFCFGFPDAAAMAAAQDALDGIGARFYDPLTEEEMSGVELEMAALVIAKMQGEAKAKAAREKIAKAFEKTKNDIDAKKQDAAELID